MHDDVTLREVRHEDLPILFEHQRDPEAVALAAFPAREREPFLAHWQKILRDPSVTARTILCDGQVAGDIVCFEQGGEREVGYWIGRPFWGQGVATRALAAFLEIVETRPLYACVARHNRPSRRVLEKCGFTVVGEEPAFAVIDGRPVPGLILRLDPPA